VLSISVSLVAVFVPLIFMGGLVGRLFREFSLTMSAAVGISLIASLTTTPMLASRLLVHHHPEDGNPEDNAVFRATRRFFDWLQGRYGKGLDWALPIAGWCCSACWARCLNIWLIAIAPKGFFPQQDTGGAHGRRARRPVDLVHRHAGQADPDREDRRADPAVDTVVAFSGGSRAGGGFLFATLKPRGERPPPMR
jgi:multidrug efflux pump